MPFHAAGGLLRGFRHEYVAQMCIILHSDATFSATHAPTKAVEISESEKRCSYVSGHYAYLAAWERASSFFCARWGGRCTRICSPCATQYYSAQPVLGSFARTNHHNQRSRALRLSWASTSEKPAPQSSGPQMTAILAWQISLAILPQMHN
jgi:hypothetical protein